MIGRLVRVVVMAALVLMAGSILWMLAYRWVTPPLTWLMIRDHVAGLDVRHRPVALADIAPDLARAVIAAEDQRFCTHNGFDFEAIEAAMARNADGGRLRGGSTISQQTAKNAFLWPGRTFLRKGLEAWFTFWMEQLWPKRRIMEVYLNSIEMGRGIYGAQAAARHWFDRSANRLTRQQAARIAAILPQPITRSASDPKRYTRRYASRIEARIRTVSRDGLDACLAAPA